MDAFQGINVMNADPMAMYNDSRIRGLQSSPIFSKELKGASKKKENVKTSETIPGDTQKKIQLKKLRDASNELVSFLFYDMIKSMRATVPEDPYLDGGMAEDVFKDMVDHEYAKSWVSSGRISLADQVYNQLSKHVK